MIAEFAAAITADRPALTDGHAGLRVLTVLEAASTSLSRPVPSAVIRSILPSQRTGAALRTAIQP